MPSLRFSSFVAAALVALAPLRAGASLGFVVAAGDSPPRWDATHVVLMRDGSRTVVTLQAQVRGEARGLALVVAVPASVQVQDVRTLAPSLLAQLDTFTAPRLVASHEQDPCPPPGPRHMPWHKSTSGAPATTSEPPAATIPEVAVGAYAVEILADEPALAAWLQTHGLRLPPGAGPQVRASLQAGQRLLVARTDAGALQFTGGRAVLPPLRWHLDEATLTLPARLGLPGAAGPRDLLVHVLAPSTRHEADTITNLAAPTNLEVGDAARVDFAGAYAAAFEHVLAAHPGALLTEYVGPVGTCLTCTTAPPGKRALQQLGADVLAGHAYPDPMDFTVTRLHTRVDDGARDIALRPGVPILGGTPGEGRERGGAGVTAATWSQFQTRWVMRRAWTGPVNCGAPVSVWRDEGEVLAAVDPAAATARPLAEFLNTGVLDGATIPQDNAAAPSERPPPAPPPTGCTRCDVGSGDLPGLLALAGLALRRRARHRRPASLA